MTITKCNYCAKFYNKKNDKKRCDDCEKEFNRIIKLLTIKGKNHDCSITNYISA